MKIIVDFNVGESLHELVGLSSQYGFMREEPRKAWTDKERKQAARFTIKKIVAERLTRYQNRSSLNPHEGETL